MRTKDFTKIAKVTRITKIRNFRNLVKCAVLAVEPFWRFHSAKLLTALRLFAVCVDFVRRVQSGTYLVNQATNVEATKIWPS